VSDEGEGLVNPERPPSMQRTSALSSVEELVADVLPDCWAYAFRLLGDYASAEDAVQDALVRVFRSRRLQRRMLSGERGLLFRIIHSCAIDELRRRNRRSRLRALLEVSYRAATEDVSTERTIVNDALAALSIEDRSVLLLVYVHGLSYDEAAVILAIPEGTVASRLSRSRRTVRVFLDKQLKEVPSK